MPHARSTRSTREQNNTKSQSSMVRLGERSQAIAVLMILLLGMAWPSADTHAATPPAPDLWVYTPCNFQATKAVDQLIALLGRAKKAGYTAALISDHKFGQMEGRPDHFYANLKRLRQAADKLDMELIVGVFPIGYSNSILMNNPNLASGLPVKDCLFRVANGQATVAYTREYLPGGDFETMDGHRARKWTWIDGPGKSSFQDTKIKRNGEASLRMTNFQIGNEVGNCRQMMHLDVKPFHQYRLSMWIKTQAVTPAGSIRAVVLAGNGRSLNHANLNVQATQDWKQHHVVFNSLENKKIRLYLGIWAGRAGTMWFDDVSLKNVGGINSLRREGCPIRVTSVDGKTVYEEGKDFRFWQYPKVGRVPWAGDFAVSHPEPPIKLTVASRIKNGQALKVSYYHTVTIYDGQVSCDLLTPELFKHLRDQVVGLKKHLRPEQWMMSHDEIRVAGFDEISMQSKKTCGQILAENAKRCVAILREADPQARINVWSDMFDPHHNAVSGYYLVRDSLADSWEGLDKNVRIVNWNFGRRDKSLAFFANRGHTQCVAGFYDRGNVASHTAQWKEAARRVRGSNAFMYTTWRSNYRELENFAKAVRGN